MFLRNSWIYVKVTSFLSNVMFAPVNFFRLLYFILVFVSSSFSISLTLYSVQKQLPDVFFRKRVLKHFLNIHRKMPVLRTRFNKIGGLQACNFIERRNIAKFLSTFYFEERIWTAASVVCTYATSCWQLTHFMPLISEKQRFSGVFRGYEKKPMTWNK